MEHKGISLKKTIEKQEEIFSASGAFVLSLLFLFQSPLHPWIGDSAYTDSSVFKTIALMMEKGYMPYLDSFDHKGPLLYIINYLGNKISYYRGIWVIEVLFLTVTLYWFYRIARLSCGKASSVITVLLASTLLFTYFEGGNLTEEYAMPCIAITIYVFLDYLKNDELSIIRIIASGIGLGMVLLLRPNMISVWAVFCIFVFIKLASAKRYHELVKIVGFFILGMVIVILPILMWLISNNAFSDFLYDYIVFNKLYSSSEGGRALFSAKWSAFITFANTTIFLASFLSLLYHLKEGNQRSIDICYMIFMIVTIVFMVMSGMAYGHYGMILVPVIIYPLSLFFNEIEGVKEERVRRTLLMIVVLYCLSTMIMPVWLDVIKNIPFAYETRTVSNVYSNETLNTILKCIDRNTDEEESISVYGNYDIVYVLSKRKHATNYSYQFPIGQVMPDIMDKYYMQLQKELPRVIVVTQDRFDDRMNSFINRNGYSLEWREDQGNIQSMTVYVKNE